MKKKIGIVLAVVLGVSALGLGVIQSSATEAAPKMDRKEIKETISAQYPGEITELELDKEGTRTVYEAEIEDNGKEYDIKLDGDTGEVLELDEKVAANNSNGQNKATNNENNAGQNESSQNNANKNADADGDDTNRNNDQKTRQNNDDNNNNSDDKNDDRMELKQNDNKDNNTNNNKSSKSAVISTAQAEKIAKNEFNGSIIKLELDEDDGRLVYEIEMKSKNNEADIEIDAYTGEIVVMEIDDNDDDDDRDDDRDNDDDDDERE
ncbi:PepSY domain-containing protein [Lentibacillus amyloliquefaciens]|uniref:PepSY domain-containing protein n=1 Tax=Lentibacillus amyloliquefaciens TaxID=1472767 RepID=A0A0U4FTG9_9BACI|nr:PepSY domain-containing protein [Lentibacillus amyloliquefaciens]ALX49157.1 hypothetical protein AOX59_11515 [Lentibacillus amyloliquefaciens]